MMDSILVKVFATALALSQVMTRPDSVKTEFDPVNDQAEVVRILSDGCNHIRKAFDIESINLDELIETAMTDTQASAGEIKAFRGIKFDDLHLAYRQFCKGETLAAPPVQISELIEFYNVTVGALPDHTRLKGLKLPGLTNVMDAGGKPYAELYDPDNRRVWVPLADVPEHVQRAFVAAEDKRFFEHKGVDERSVIRAFITTLADPKRRQGGSTITQQVVKNLLVGDDVTYERKIREIIVASRLEKELTKQEILEIYLNAIYLGRSSWGIETAARAYFGKGAKDLTLHEGAFLAGLTKGPNYYNPDRYRERAQGRLGYVLTRMHEDGTIDESQLKAAEAQQLAFIAHARPRRDTGFHIVDHLRREAQSMAGVGSLTASSYTVRSTIVPQLQRAAEAAVQDGLARYEQNTGRVRFTGAEANLAASIRQLQSKTGADAAQPPWQQALQAGQLPLYDVHWQPAVVLEKVRMKQGYDSIRVGLRDGRVLPLSTPSQHARNALGTYDVVYVSVSESKPDAKGRGGGTLVQLRARPTVQAAAVVIENHTGRILAMVGGFSYPLSQLNRATQSRRQPGSAFKPVVYLAALSGGLQPNTLVQDGPITLPPIGSTIYAREKDWWSPKNYDGRYSGTMTLRRALEHSKNLVTAHLLDGGIAGTPAQSLDKVCRVAMEAQLYTQCERYYPFILGAQAVRPIDLAAFYAAIANEGRRPTPYVIESIEKDGRTIYQQTPKLIGIGSTDRPAAFQLKSILQGVVARGTAASINRHATYVAGKTGTTDGENDAWFVGFSNDVTIAVWVGYDNNRGKRTLGGGQTGSKVALPIFESIIRASWEFHAPQTALRGPSTEASKQLVSLPIDLRSGARITNRSPGAFMEQFRLDASGRFLETQYKLVARDGYYPYSDSWNDHTRYDHGPPGRIYRQYEPPPFFGEPRREDPRLRQPPPNVFFPPFFFGGPRW